MSFNENAFIIAGTAIAIAGVGLYLWDTRKDNVVNAYNQYSQVGDTQQAGSKRYRKKKPDKKTRKHN